MKKILDLSSWSRWSLSLSKGAATIRLLPPSFRAPTRNLAVPKNKRVRLRQKNQTSPVHREVLHHPN